MMCWKIGLFLFAGSILFSSASVVLSPGPSNLCVGETGPCRRTFTCDVTGSELVWGYTGFTGILFSSSDTSTRSFGQAIEVRLLSIYNGVVRSMATVNVTNDINGTELQCRNQLFEPGSINKKVDFFVEYTTPVTQTFWEAIDSTSNITVLVTWPMATCAAMYNGTVEINGQLRHTRPGLESTFFMFDVKKNDVNDGGIYTIAVSSVDYYGISVGVPSTRNISINTPEFTVSNVIDCMDKNLSLIISEKEGPSVSYLDVVSCEISLANDTYMYMYYDTESCIGKKIDFNITVGGSYNYNVTVTNLFGSSSMLNVTNTNICIEMIASTQTTTTTTVSESTTTTQTTMTTDIISPSVSPSESPNATAFADNTTYIATSASFGSLFGLLLAFIVFERLRCFCPTASFWSIVFCDCLAKGDKKTMPFDGEEIPNKKETDVSSDL